MRARSCWFGLFVVVAGCGGVIDTSREPGLDPAEESAKHYGLHVIWLQGEGEANRARLDEFTDYLLASTNFTSYWGGAIGVVRRETAVVAAPSSIPGCGSPCEPGNMGKWIGQLIAAGEVAAPVAGEVPIYEVLIDHHVTHGTRIDRGAGGSNGTGTVDGRTAGLFYVTTTSDLFWPGRAAFANETIATEHELAENVNLLRGGFGAGLIGDGACESYLDGVSCRPDLNEGVGPSTITTSDGCGNLVTGWLVQPLATRDDAWASGEPRTCDHFKLKNVAAAPRCGDGSCNGSESCTSCPGDCGACPPRCGDGACNGGDTCASCPGDCGVCPAASWRLPSGSDAYPANGSDVCGGANAAARDGSSAGLDHAQGAASFDVAGRPESSCVRIHFPDRYLATRVRVVAAWAGQACGQPCAGSYCGGSARYDLFVYDRNASQYVWLETRTGLTQALAEYESAAPGIETDTVLVCRTGAGYAYDDVLVDYAELFGG
jgi:hypothetical protein